MLRFAVYDDDGPASEHALVNAHLLGREDAVTPGKVKFRKGQIVCQKQGSQSTALCLQHDAGKAGTLMLQTCLLPDREEPYGLTIELARARIKAFITVRARR